MAARQWTPEQREQQAKRIREHKPWELSTGAKTSKGKRKVSRNGFKHGCSVRMTREEYIGFIRKMSPAIVDNTDLLEPLLAKMTFYDETSANQEDIKPIIRQLIQAQALIKHTKRTVWTINDIEEARRHIKPIIQELCQVSKFAMDACELLIALGKSLENNSQDKKPFK